MSRMSRIALLVLIFLCIIALIVIFATALFSGGSDKDGGDTGTASASPPGASTSDGDTDGAVTPSQVASPSVTPSPTETPEETSSAPPNDGPRTTFRAPGSENTLSAVVDTEMFRHSQSNSADAFFDVAVENDRVYIEFCYFPDKSAEVNAPGFLNDYIEFADHNDRGRESIGATGLSGYSVEATDGVNTFEAWLIDENQGGALTIVMSYSTAPQRAALHAIFDSLALAG
jgi:hypothetical protein